MVIRCCIFSVLIRSHIIIHTCMHMQSCLPTPAPHNELPQHHWARLHIEIQYTINSTTLDAHNKVIHTYIHVLSVTKFFPANLYIWCSCAMHMHMHMHVKIDLEKMSMGAWFEPSHLRCPIRLVEHTSTMHCVMGWSPKCNSCLGKSWPGLWLTLCSIPVCASM